MDVNDEKKLEELKENLSGLSEILLRLENNESKTPLGMLDIKNKHCELKLYFLRRFSNVDFSKEEEAYEAMLPKINKYLESLPSKISTGHI